MGEAEISGKKLESEPSLEIKTIGDLNNFLRHLGLASDAWIDGPEDARNIYSFSRGEFYKNLLSALGGTSETLDIKDLNLPDSTPLNDEAVAIISQLLKTIRETGLWFDTPYTKRSTT